MAHRTDKTNRSLENFRAKYEREKNKPGMEGVFARAMLEMMPGVQAFFEGETGRGTTEEQIEHAIATYIANVLLLTGQLVTNKTNRASVANEIMAKVYRLVDGKLGQTAGGIILPGGAYGRPQ